jgi:hypothetical protein
MSWTLVAATLTVVGQCHRGFDCAWILVVSCFRHARRGGCSRYRRVLLLEPGLFGGECV